MSRMCEVCGRPIKTGRKYCWIHRKAGYEENRQKPKIPLPVYMFMGFMLLAIFIIETFKDSLLGNILVLLSFILLISGVWFYYKLKGS